MNKSPVQAGLQAAAEQPVSTSSQRGFHTSCKRSFPSRCPAPLWNLHELCTVKCHCKPSALIRVVCLDGLLSLLALGVFHHSCTCCFHITLKVVKKIGDGNSLTEIKYIYYIDYYRHQAFEALRVIKQNCLGNTFWVYASVNVAHGVT